MSKVDEAIARARALVGVARYAREATLDGAPFVVNCITLWQWAVREEYGIVLPERLLSLETPIALEELSHGDIVLAPQCPAWNGEDDWGHSGVLTREYTVIHATRRLRKGQIIGGIREDHLDQFLRKGFLGARRIFSR